MPQGLPTVIPNAVIEAAWGNAVADRVVGRFANTTERDAAIPAPVAGMVCSVAGILQQRTAAGTWLPFAPAPRVGCSLTTTGQSAPSGVGTDLGWTTEVYDTDNFHAGTVPAVVIPAGLGGVYSFAGYVDAGGTINGPSVIAVRAGASINRMAYVPAGNQFLHVATIFEAAAGASITLRLTSGHSATITVSGQFNVARLST